MSAAALVRLARQGELAEGQKIVKVGLVAAPACREGRGGPGRAPEPAAEPLCLQLLVGPSPHHCRPGQSWVACGRLPAWVAEPGSTGGRQLQAPDQRSPPATAPPTPRRLLPLPAPAGDPWQEDPAGPHTRAGVCHRRALLPHGR